MRFIFAVLSLFSIVTARADTLKAMSVEDFLLDVSTLKGSVAVKGSTSCLQGTLCYLHGSNFMTMLNFDASNLPREDRRRLMSCQPLVEPCNVVVYGIARPKDSLSKFSAYTIEFELSPEEAAATDLNLPRCDTIEKSEVVELIEHSKLAKTLSLKIFETRLEITKDDRNRVFCSASLITSGGEKRISYYLKRIQTGGFYIAGRWSTN